ADGRAYSADDPALLTWVHAAEVWCFLRAYVRYRNPDFSLAMQNRYLDEIALVAEQLGAIDVPRNLKDLESYIDSMRPQLRCEERTLKTVELVLNAPAPAECAGVAVYAPDDTRRRGLAARLGQAATGDDAVAAAATGTAATRRRSGGEAGTLGGVRAPPSLHVSAWPADPDQGIDLVGIG
ncbi:oxygenase MpaB family protein, partial [Herbaspirillum lusitanum]|uniref:oxygenase MpaB family protein n=1 Tax=Herbaspirillum lusitanum TaxID=213312 RepID=UPI0012F4981E